MRRLDAELRTIRADDPNLSCSDTVVDPRLSVGRRSYGFSLLCNGLLPQIGYGTGTKADATGADCLSHEGRNSCHRPGRTISGQVGFGANPNPLPNRLSR